LKVGHIIDFSFKETGRKLKGTTNRTQVFQRTEYILLEYIRVG